MIMRRFLSGIFLLVLGFLVLGAQNKVTPSMVLSKTVNRITGSRGVDASFKVYNSGYSGSGVLKMSGSKFIVSLPDAKVWYNGKDMYTYNESSGETTLVTPTAQELAETNPLEYVKGAQAKYNVAYSTVKKKDRYVLELTPKVKSKGEIKRITLTVKQADFTPEKIVVETAGASPISADILTFKTGIAIPESDFQYPKTKYPKVEIIDLR